MKIAAGTQNQNESHIANSMLKAAQKADSNRCPTKGLPNQQGQQGV